MPDEAKHSDENLDIETTESIETSTVVETVGSVTVELEKNLTALETFFPGLADKIRQTEITENTLVFLTEGGDINIAHEYKPCHSLDDPFQEALNKFNEDIPEEAKEDDGCVYFLFGLGIGYLLRRLFVETKGFIIVFEPNIEILRQTLELVDFSEEIASGRVRIIVRKEDISAVFGSTHIIGDSLYCTWLPMYQNYYAELLKESLEEVRSSLFNNTVNQNTAVALGDEFTKMSVSNLPLFLRYPSPQFLHDEFKGMPGIVVSAGPSLDKPGVLETLKKYQDNVVIACVGQAAKALDAAGIIPDFVCLIECADVAQQLEGVSYLDKTAMVLLPQTNASIYAFESKYKLIAHPNRDPLTLWVADALEKDIFGYGHQGTVSVTATVLLKLLGCDPIFLLGQDLSFPEGKMYANDSVYKGQHFELDEENGKGANLVMDDDVLESIAGKKGFAADKETVFARQQGHIRNLIETKGWNGEKLFTLVTYAAFAKAFEDICQASSHQMVNCSEGGRYLEGFEHLKFTEAAEKYEFGKYQARQKMQQLFDEHYAEEELYGPSFQLAKLRFEEDEAALNEMIELSEKSLDACVKTLKHLDKRKTIDHSIQSRLKKMANIDEEIKDLTRSHRLINAYIARDMLVYARLYGRKISTEGTDNHEEDLIGNVEEMQDNLKYSQILYRAIKRGSEALLESMLPVFKNDDSNEEDAKQCIIKAKKSVAKEVNAEFIA